MPCRRRQAAVPSVAMIVKPSSENWRAASTTAGRSLSATVISTVPSSGSVCCAASCALKNASPKDSAMPSTSPVERISGPSTGSTSGNMLNGNTASLTPKCGIGACCEVRDRPASCPASAGWRSAPSGCCRPWTPAAPCARRAGWPPARRPCRWRWRTACSSGRPRFSSMAIRRVYSRIVSRCLAGMLTGGITQAESPEWMPGQFDVLHDRRDEGVRAVGDGVGLGLDGVLQELVDQDRPLGRDVHRRRHVVRAASPRRGPLPCRGRPAHSEGRTISG